MTTIVLDAFFEKSKNNNDGVYRCFTCGTKIPEHLVACWNCGQVLSEKIRKLVKNK